MLRWSCRRLAPADGVAAAAGAVGVERLCTGDAAGQKAALRDLLRAHDASVARNAAGTICVTNTYGTEAALHFDRYNLAVLPAVNGGAARQPLRSRLAESGAVRGVCETVVAPWQAGGERAVVVFGCRSTAYLRRQLASDCTHTFFVVDSSLRDLTEAAAALTPEFASRIFFLRCEAMFTCLEVLQPDTVDVALVPMPVPYWSRQGSHRRLVHVDFFCAVHRTLRQRESPADPRGVVLFTDCEPYAAFMMEHLEEAKLIVPFTRKNPRDAFRRWLPLDDASADGETSGRRPREFAKQREREVVAMAAAKSGPTTAEAAQLLQSYAYTRKYYRDLAAEPPTE